ncbi:hypothetical protein [Streptomyces odontomachi]|uniref:hypothetical protein n=1 Tax=Streptomyces odontomachi TaxID=2944940 RepID=UPI00210D2669|nr:hypothetical protein [Streptomyces sp. ODS25]
MIHRSADPLSLREDADVFGSPDPGQPVRVEVQVRACLTFAELLGLLLFTPGLSMEYGELDDDEVIRDSLHYAVLETDLDTMERYAYRAEFAYQGSDRVPAEYTRRVAAAITRVYGVAA